jgi:hypothetical protein
VKEWQIECGAHKGTVRAETIGAAWRKLVRGKTKGFAPLARFKSLHEGQRVWHYVEPAALDGLADAEARKEEGMGKRELIDIAAEIKGETERAWRLYDGSKTEWVPKSQVEQNDDGTFTMPEWLAKEKGFL